MFMTFFLIKLKIWITYDFVILSSIINFFSKYFIYKTGIKNKSKTYGTIFKNELSAIWRLGLGVIDKWHVHLVTDDLKFCYYMYMY